MKTNSEFKYDNSENQLRKKIKLENQKILDKIKEIVQVTMVRILCSCAGIC